MRIVFKNRHVVIIDKPAGMPAQSDPTGDLDAMSAAEKELEALREELFGEAATDYVKAAATEEKIAVLEDELLNLYELTME